MYQHSLVGALHGVSRDQRWYGRERTREQLVRTDHVGTFLKSSSWRVYGRLSDYSGSLRQRATVFRIWNNKVSRSWRDRLVVATC